MSNGRTIKLEEFIWDQDESDKDANFKKEVALYTMNDPMPTIDRISHNLDVPVGAVVKYILTKWAASGSESLLEAGPDMVEKMSAIFEDAEKSGTLDSRLQAYSSVKDIVSWLRVPLDDPDYRNGIKD